MNTSDFRFKVLYVGEWVDGQEIIMPLCGPTWSGKAEFGSAVSWGYVWQKIHEVCLLFDKKVKESLLAEINVDWNHNKIESKQTRLGYYDVTARLILLMICLVILLLFTICCMIFVICYLLLFFYYLLFVIFHLLFASVTSFFLFLVICYLTFFVIFLSVIC